jgi:hypothetical protein
MPKWRDWTELIFAPLTVAGTTADVKSKARVGLTGGKEKQAQDVAGGFRYRSPGTPIGQRGSTPNKIDAAVATKVSEFREFSLRTIDGKTTFIRSEKSKSQRRNSIRRKRSKRSSIMISMGSV